MITHKGKSYIVYSETLIEQLIQYTSSGGNEHTRRRRVDPESQTGRELLALAVTALEKRLRTCLDLQAHYDGEVRLLAMQQALQN